MSLRKKIIDKLFVRRINLKTKSHGSIGIISSLTCAAVCFVSASVLAVKLPDEPQNNRTQTTESHTSSVVFNAEKALPVSLSAKSIIIEPGESQVQKEERAKIEAEAQAKAKLAVQKHRIDTVSRERRVYNDPSDYNIVYDAAAVRFGVDARLLRAIHYVETGCSGSTTKSSFAGAIGPMQFLQSTFRKHAVDGNGDGVTDVTNLEDSVFTAAAYLKACGYPNLKSALYGYNPSAVYYNKVAKVARSLGMDI